VKRVPTDHAGGKWRLGYLRAAGGTGTLELDLNFILRTPLWPVQLRDARMVARQTAHAVPVLDLHGLIGGKLAALFGRTAARDVFDAHELLSRTGLDGRRLRLAFVVYGAVNRRATSSVAPRRCSPRSSTAPSTSEAGIRETSAPSNVTSTDPRVTTSIPPGWPRAELSALIRGPRSIPSGSIPQRGCDLPNGASGERSLGIRLRSVDPERVAGWVGGAEWRW
jgi:hypothetical protein